MRLSLHLPQLLLCLLVVVPAANAQWRRHTIDNTSQGADGVRLHDINQDGLFDLCVGWEEGGIVRIYLHPGKAQVRKPWPAATISKVSSPEDAVFLDLNQDGAVDVVSACEGKERNLFVHWAPTNIDDLLKPEAWRTEVFPGNPKRLMWMFTLPWPNANGGVDLVAGSKGRGAEVGIFAQQMPELAWKWQPIAPAAWIMSLVSEDINLDGKPDLVYSDRKGKDRGIYWVDMADLNQPGKPQLLGGVDHEVMFLDIADIDQDGHRDIVAATHDAGLLLLHRRGDAAVFEPIEIPLPGRSGTGKSVKVGDMDGDGQADLVFSCENANGKRGIGWLTTPSKSRQDLTTARWSLSDISGTTEGIKFDLLQLVDLDQDGDLDVLTCEERDNLGVIWYENPSR
ncbi:VCBS repeat-containing protein [Bremerella sp. JC817]|uniref:FG-GAP repeat domain-containing protein n=1 Tax=Bremerella sp. JC817 TaxID=3231756 RepID=UPI003459F81B